MGRDGFVYGTTEDGGRFGQGIVYRTDLAGDVTILHHFTGGADGTAPALSFQDADGRLFGTTGLGGTPPPGCHLPPQGTAFVMDLAGHVRTLHTFCENLDGAGPDSIVRGPDGALYGTCAFDGPLPNGSTGAGTFWRLERDGTTAVLHVFVGTRLDGDDGAEPNGIVLHPDGNFYGTTNGGGAQSNGTIFRATTDGTVTTIHSFDAFASDGRDPESTLRLEPGGTFLGSAADGGLPVDEPTREGVLFRADTRGHVTVLHTFREDDGARPAAAPLLVEGRAGGLRNGDLARPPGLGDHGGGGRVGRLTRPARVWDRRWDGDAPV